MRIILASQSQTRKRALDLLGLKYETIPPNIDEEAIRDENPLLLAKKLSEAKARAIGSQQQGLIIASDAFLVFQGKILEKPCDLKEAYNMLHSLSGNNYTFITGIAVYNSISNHLHSSVDTCEIYFRDLREEEIVDYINRNTVLKFAGAHDTDGVIRFSERVVGNCNFFTAIPMNKLIEFLGYHD